jgi:hypothetical protein
LGKKRDDEYGDWNNLYEYNEELHNLLYVPDIIKMI